MTATDQTTVTGRTVYSLEGTMLEACSCGVLCPCWIGADPDGGRCSGFIAYQLTRGEVDGVDVGGLHLAVVAEIPGNVLEGGWRAVVFVDRDADDHQRDALVRAFTGRLGGPLADLAALIGEVEGPYSVPFTHDVVQGRGVLRVGTVIDAEMEPVEGAGGTTTTLRDATLSTIPGGPVYVARTTRHQVDVLEHGMVWHYEGRNAMHADWKMEHVA